MTEYKYYAMYLSTGEKFEITQLAVNTLQMLELINSWNRQATLGKVSWIYWM